MSKKLIYFVSFVLVAALNSNALAGLIDDSSLVIYFSFDSVSDIVTDQSGNGHDGTVNGDITAEPNGKYNGAAKFDGTRGPVKHSYVDMDGENFPAEEVPTTGMTLAAWAKCENTGRTLIGLRSFGLIEFDTFGTGVIMEHFHMEGKTPSANILLIRYAIDDDNTETPSFNIIA